MIERNPELPDFRMVSGQYHATDPATAFTCTVLWGEGHAAILDDKPNPSGAVQMASMSTPIEEFVAPYRERLRGGSLNLEMPFIMHLIARLRLLDRSQDSPSAVERKRVARVRETIASLEQLANIYAQTIPFWPVSELSEMKQRLSRTLEKIAAARMEISV